MTKNGSKSIVPRGVRLLAWAQLPIAALAVGAFVFVGAKIEPLIQRERDLQQQITRSQIQIKQYQSQIKELRESVRQAREGINLFHEGEYGAAVQSYDEALKIDPQNAYIQNLKGYALFKQKRFKEAIDALEKSVQADPQYAWGYFDLARTYCADKQFQQAVVAGERAIKLRPEMRDAMRSDAEFQRLCKPILPKLK